MTAHVAMTRQHKGLAWMLCALALMGLLAACAQNDGSALASAGRQSFNLSMTGEDGVQVSWRGRDGAFRPGSAETMHLAVVNNTGRAWNGRFCLQLLEPSPSSVAIPLVRQEFRLEAGASFTQYVRAELPANLPPGVHGLALVMHKPGGPMVQVIPVQVGGGESEPFDGDWPTDAALVACPAP